MRPLFFKLTLWNDPQKGAKRPAEWGACHGANRQGARVGGYAAWLAGGWRGQCMGWVTHRMLRRGCETSLPYLLALLSRTPLSRSLGCLSHVLAWLSSGRSWCVVTCPWALGHSACLCLLDGRSVSMRCVYLCAWVRPNWYWAWGRRVCVSAVCVPRSGRGGLKSSSRFLLGWGACCQGILVVAALPPSFTNEREFPNEGQVLPSNWWLRARRQ